MGTLATPPPFKSADWSVTATEITISNYRGDEGRRTGYQFRIDRGEWLDSSAFVTLTDVGTYLIEIRAIISDNLYGARSDVKEVEVV